MLLLYVYIYIYIRELPVRSGTTARTAIDKQLLYTINMNNHNHNNTNNMYVCVCRGRVSPL